MWNKRIMFIFAAFYQLLNVMLISIYNLLLRPKRTDAGSPQGSTGRTSVLLGLFILYTR